jgi:hypothetical protein
MERTLVHAALARIEKAQDSFVLGQSAQSKGGGGETLNTGMTIRPLGIPKIDKYHDKWKFAAKGRGGASESTPRARRKSAFCLAINPLILCRVLVLAWP